MARGAGQVKSNLTTDEGSNLPTAIENISQTAEVKKPSSQGDCDHACHGSPKSEEMSASSSPQNSAAVDVSPVLSKQKAIATILSETQISKHYHPHPSATPHPARSPPACDDAGVPTLWKGRVRRDMLRRQPRGLMKSPRIVSDGSSYFESKGFSNAKI